MNNESFIGFILGKTIDFFTSKRMQSLYWRAAGMVFVSSSDFIMSDLHQFYESDSWQVVFAGLILGEVTKKLNSKK